MWQSCELGLDSVDFFAMQGGGSRHTGRMPTDDKENTVYTERSEGKNRCCPYAVTANAAVRKKIRWLS
ncbi:hypothetical protein SAMN04488502_101962 [Dendrosporobacter quercicolus]|uniref:Uncharacterized protein n=1 Tax=Dendrosporobacter quercicolus TaxID=146817 RepID=A0A1G9NBY2_9FIRM|nr:hypothetical protein SAMN04488502_101962 [Dendrosporobacter quercicolus]